MTALPQYLLDIVPNAVHVHARANLPENGCQGEQTLEEVVASARTLGMTEVYLTDHTSNPGPGQPHPFAIGDELGEALRGYFDSVDFVAAGQEFSLHPGLEANILADGTLDAPRALTQDAVLTIASLHGKVPDSGEEAFNRLIWAMDNDETDMIGHPQRYVNVFEVDWDGVFEMAGDPSLPTLVEANFNAWFNYGPGKLRHKGETDKAIAADKAEKHFYEALGRSSAPVVVALDVHKEPMWPSESPAEYWMPSITDFEDYLDLLFVCGISEERIINRRLRDWLLLPKSDRGKLMTWL